MTTTSAGAAHRLAIGVDLGGTNLRCAVVDAHGTIHAERSQPTHAEHGPVAVIATIGQIVQEVATHAGIPASVPIGIAAPGPLNPSTGVVHFAPNLPGWHDIPLRQMVADSTGRSTILGNDANAAALGEYHFGAGRGYRHVIYIGLGTGVGGGVISDGRLIDGRDGMGAELGHVSVSIDGPRCHCGALGCVEAYCSGWALTDEIDLLVKSQRAEAIVAAAAGGAIGPVAAGIAAAHGDPTATALLSRAGEALGTGLASFVNIFNPEVIAIGGGLAELGDPLLGPARRALASRSMPMMLRDVRIVLSQLGGKTGIYGAAALVFHHS